MLVLVLDKGPFEVMQTGEKMVEYRTDNAYWRSRIAGRGHTHVEFRAGYLPGCRRFTRRLVRVQALAFVDETFSNGLRVHARNQLALHLDFDL